MTKPVAGKLDPGIVRYVRTLQKEGVETYESCEGGPGHAYPVPTVRFYGREGAGWHALSACYDHGFPTAELRRVWDIIDGQPTGPYWELVFKRKSE
jgi:hypothetical protein